MKIEKSIKIQGMHDCCFVQRLSDCKISIGSVIVEDSELPSFLVALPAAIAQLPAASEPESPATSQAK